MRLRVGALLKQRDMTAYELAKRSGGRISVPSAYRYAKDEWKSISSEVLDALCDVLGIDDPGPLFTRGKSEGSRHANKARRRV